MQRRLFLKTGVATAAAFSLAGLVQPIRRAEAAVISVNLIAEAVPITLFGVATTIWRFRNPAQPGPGWLAAGLVIQEGDEVTVTVTNNLPLAINLGVPGLLTGAPQVAPGGTQVYSFTASKAGSYFFVDETNGELSKAMGLSGPLVVTPPGGANTLYTGGPAFQQQYVLMLHEMDTRVNNAVAAGQPADLTTYEPDFYFVNGLSYPALEIDPSTAIKMSVNQSVALRFINTGLHVNSMHFHGWHVNVATRNRTPETAVVDKDTVPVDVGECVEVILNVGTQVGKYELHNHFLAAVTGNGLYPNGAMLIMESV